MSRVTCSIEPADLDGDHGRTVPGVRATCSECDHQTESFGTGEGSRRRCLILMREECPLGKTNFYVDEDEG